MHFDASGARNDLLFTISFTYGRRRERVVFSRHWEPRLNLRSLKIRQSWGSSHKLRTRQPACYSAPSITLADEADAHDSASRPALSDAHFARQLLVAAISYLKGAAGSRWVVERAAVHESRVIPDWLFSGKTIATGGKQVSTSAESESATFHWKRPATCNYAGDYCALRGGRSR